MNNYWKSNPFLITPNSDPFIDSFASQLPQSEIEYSLGNLPYLTGQENVFLFDNRLVVAYNEHGTGSIQPPERKKGDINKFSENSRRRLIRLLSTVNLHAYGTVLFCTTTFHKIYPEDNPELKRILDIFLKRMNRRFPDLSYIWRLEFQQRGAPHFHFFFLFQENMSERDQYLYELKIHSMWNTLLQDESRLTHQHSVDVARCDSKQKVFAYISKYTSKEDAEENADYKGRRYGFSRNINLKERFSIRANELFLKALRKEIFEYMRQKQKLSQEFIKHLTLDSHVGICIEFDEALEILISLAGRLNHNYLRKMLLNYYYSSDYHDNLQSNHFFQLAT